uniref:Uncharacterized protein n=1 Tax=Romanomermis culicivorax TaxID=13658 RepID=A0A915HPP9_ROMCU
MGQTLPALPKDRSAQGYGLPKSDLDIACCRSGFGTDSVVGFAAAAPEIRDAGQCKPVNDVENDWRRQPNCVVSTNGSEPWSPAVDAVRHAVEEASPNAQPTAVVAALPSTTTTGAQTLAAIAQQQPVAAVKLPPTVPNAFRETLRAINDDVSIIKASPFPTATALRSPKI